MQVPPTHRTETSLVRRSQGTKSPDGYFHPNQGHHQWNLDFLDNGHASSTTDLPQHTVSEPFSKVDADAVLTIFFFEQESPSSKPALDPFDIDSLAQETRGATPHQAIPEMDDDNPLGILSGPALPRSAPVCVAVSLRDGNNVTHPKTYQTQDVDTPSSSPSPSLSSHASPQQRASPAQRQSDLLLAQMVDMGFEMEEAKVALEATGGEDLQSAVDLIVHNAAALREQRPPQRQPEPQQPERYQDAMDDASDTARARMALFSDEPLPPRRKPAASAHDRPESPSSEFADSRQQQQQQQQQINFQQHKEKIVAQASELGGFLYKNASLFVKTGRQRINKAVEDWQEQQRAEQLHRQQGRPRWMTEAVEDDPDLQAVREQQLREQQQRRQQRQQQRAGRTSDEAPSSPSQSEQTQQTQQVQPQEPFVEKFVDDDSSDEDPELEKRREMEWKQLQEAKRREYVMQKRRQQEEQARARRQQQLKEEQDVYVSPSRRRATPSARSSAASTPRSGTPTQARPPPAAVQRQERQRPVVDASPDVLARANAARQQGNDQFKLGQFGDAEAAYTRAIDVLPSGHDHLAVLSNNRAAALLKMGEYKRCIADCVLASDLARTARGEGQRVCGGITIVWRDQLVKALSRQAEACEHLEKYHDAIQVYEALMQVEGTRNAKINQGLARCRQAIQPKKKAPTPPKKQQSSSAPASNAGSAFPTVDYSVFETKHSQGVENSKAVAAMRAQAAQQEAEEAERLSKTDDVNARILHWKAGKEHNLRALLATLDTLLWPGAQWRGANISELIDPKKCKITYLKAISKVHPDKVS